MGVTSPKAKQPLQGMDNTKKKKQSREIQTKMNRI